MLGLLTAAIAFLAVATAVNLVLLFAVIRKLRGVESGHGHGAAADQLPAVGLRVGTFEVPDLQGSAVTTTDVADSLVACVMTGCTPCAEMIATLKTDSRPDADRTFFFVFGDPRDEATTDLLAELAGLGRIAMLEPDGPVGPAFGGITSYPTLLRVSDGAVAAAGRKLDEVFTEKSRALSVVR